MTIDAVIRELRSIQKQTPLGADTEVYLCDERGNYVATDGVDFEVVGDAITAVLYAKRS